MAQDESEQDPMLRTLDTISVSALAARAALLDVIGKRPQQDPVLSALETIISTALAARASRVTALEDAPGPEPLLVALDTLISEIRQIRASVDRLAGRFGDGGRSAARGETESPGA